MSAAYTNNVAYYLEVIILTLLSLSSPIYANCIRYAIFPHIYIYTYRDWFLPSPSPFQLIRDELLVEKTLRLAAEQVCNNVMYMLCC